jgi:quinol monooxygenase YgiN
MEKVLIVKWQIKEGKTESILELLPELAEQTKKEKGNLSYRIYRSENNPNELILHESYSDDAAIAIHKNSEYYQRIVVNQILPHLEFREVILLSKLI